jgi:hypothetical protein
MNPKYIFYVSLQNFLTKFGYYHNSTNLNDNMTLVYNHCIKISNDFNKMILQIVHKWINLTHSYNNYKEIIT